MVVHIANHPDVEHSANIQRVYGENAAMNIGIFQAALETASAASSMPVPSRQ